MRPLQPSCQSENATYDGFFGPSAEGKQNTINMNVQNPNIETPAAPEWLQKLENRREKLTKSRLGHELGAGAPCDECGDKCPGLDLHFWRKVCRNCKCRKEKHRCTDDDLTGWAQFEVLGQIRSKPAFIKIKALASQPVQLEWVPPNATPDLVSDYMEKLGTAKIPVAGSDAAQWRKQQLEFQVPPHDLDAALCDNLTESETAQLLQYVQKIRDSCVGQGNVVRIGTQKVGQVSGFAAEDGAKAEYVQVMAALNEVPVTDPVLAELLSTEKLAKAIVADTASVQPKMLIAFNAPISETSPMEFENAAILSKAVQAKLCGLNKQTVGSLVHNGPIYDKVLGVLKKKNFDISRDARLGPIADFRKEYLLNPQFKHEIDSIMIGDNKGTQYTTPIKSKLPDTVFHSPLPLTQPALARFGAQMRQDTPMRKVKFGSTSTIIYDCGLPANVDYERDPVFAKIINSVPLKHAFEKPSSVLQQQPVVIQTLPMNPDFEYDPAIGELIRQTLPTMSVDNQALQSAMLNGPFYDRLFETLKDKDIDFKKCKLLAPIEELRSQLIKNKPFSELMRAYVTKLPNSQAISYGSPQHAVKSALTGSSSNDSGFDSKPTTPNAAYGDDMHALSGKFTSIPGIEDMNMYPSVEPSKLLHNMQNLGISGVQPIDAVVPLPLLKCRDCTLPINFGEVAVKAERAGREIAWHPECFKCHTCRELLADLVYFFHSGQVYCGRDLAIKLKIPRCRACDELIFTKEYTAAEGATFHIKHFCCYQCDTPLAGQQYIPDEKSNMPLCLKCYEEFFAAACQRCKRPIEAAGQGVSWGNVHWHANCFICSGLDCGKSLIGGRFCVKEDMPFCSPACVRSIIK